MEEIVLFEGFNDADDCSFCIDDEGIDWDTRHCISVKKGKGGKCVCSEYAYGVRPPHTPTFKELCSKRGLSSSKPSFKGGNKIMAKSLLSPLKMLGIQPSILKSTLIIGVIAAGGLWITHTVNEKVSNMLKLTGWSRNLMFLLMGGIAGGLAYKFTKKKEYALAAGLGPVLVVTLQTLGKAALFCNGTYGSYGRFRGYNR